MNKLAASTLRLVMGPNAVPKLLHARNALWQLKARIKGLPGTVKFSTQRPYELYSIPGQNLFFGYYDLPQYNPDRTKLLAHAISPDANPSRESARLLWIDPADKSIHPFATTRAWCWQQGARLRWHPTQPDTVLFNEFDGTDYHTCQIDLATSRRTRVSKALYDVDSAFRFGLGLDFDRLQRLRPGYGYSCKPDASAKDLAPDNGIFRVDFASGRETPLFSLRDLAHGLDTPSQQHYLNHISISPGGIRFMFFHLWTASATSPWHMRFYVANTDGSGLTLLEDDVRISHYCWVDDDHLLATRRVEGKTFQHVLYNLADGTQVVNVSPEINVDGHPSPLGNGFITDTYPKRDLMQYVYLSDFAGTWAKEILRLYADPLRYGETRCDLHPRLFHGRHVTLDTTCLGGERSILAFDLLDEEVESLTTPTSRKED